MGACNKTEKHIKRFSVIIVITFINMPLYRNSPGSVMIQALAVMYLYIHVSLSLQIQKHRDNTQSKLYG